MTVLDELIPPIVSRLEAIETFSDRFAKIDSHSQLIQKIDESIKKSE
jgi:hypothetical protein